MIPLFKPFVSSDVDAELLKTLHSGFIGQGPKVEEFEKALIPYVGRDTLLTLNSCTSALQLALRLAGVGPGDEVISTPVTCLATNEPIALTGAKIVWADVDPRSGNIDPESIAGCITERTKAIMVVHWGGTPCDLEAINKIADQYCIPVIEDAAHAFGASYHGRPIGSHSDFVCFSFQAIKHLTTGDGGLLVCRKFKDYERAKLLRWYGVSRDTPRKDFRCEADVSEWGYKFHMNDINATIGLANLKHFPEILRAHRSHAAYLTGRVPQPIPFSSNSAYWLYTIRRTDRDAFMDKMTKAGVQVSQVHARNDTHSMFKAFARRDLPGVDEFCKEQASIPVGWWLSPQDLDTIVKAALS